MNALTVMPLRYSADVPAMVDFLVTLGMARHVTTSRDGFAELVAGTGRVMVHTTATADAHATPGQTVLGFSTANADAAAERLAEAGFEVDVWDESYGRQAMITGPAGEAIWINEEQDDLYGYEGHDSSRADPRLTVAAIRPSTDFGTDRDYFGRLGFASDPGAGEWWEGMRGPGGVVGLHRPEGAGSGALASDDPRHRFPLVNLGFQTTEPLEDLCDRLATAGYAGQIVAVPEATKVHVTDPDGQVLEIHPVPEFAR